MFNITNIVNRMTERMDSIKTPAPSIPPTLLKCLSLQRAGLSPYKIAAKIIENNKKLGIPTEPNPDGSENVINQYTYNITKCIVEAIQEDAKVSVAIPMQSLLIQTMGGNAGGPVVCTGTNLTDTLGTGAIQ